MSYVVTLLAEIVQNHSEKRQWFDEVPVPLPLHGFQTPEEVAWLRSHWEGTPGPCNVASNPWVIPGPAHTQWLVGTFEIILPSCFGGLR